jgi:hypothetical protein
MFEKSSDRELTARTRVHPSPLLEEKRNAVTLPNESRHLREISRLVARLPPGLMVLNWNQGIGGAIGLWPLSDRSAAPLTNAQMKEADVTGRSAKHRLANGNISGMVLRPELIGTCAIRVLLGDGLCHWFNTGAIAYPCQLLALPRQKLEICSPDLVSIAGKRLMPCPTVLRFSLSTRAVKSLFLC